MNRSTPAPERETFPLIKGYALKLYGLDLLDFGGTLIAPDGSEAYFITMGYWCFHLYHATPELLNQSAGTRTVEVGTHIDITHLIDAANAFLASRG
jgi:hypothetical protein